MQLGSVQTPVSNKVVYVEKHSSEAKPTAGVIIALVLACLVLGFVGSFGYLFWKRRSEQQRADNQQRVLNWSSTQSMLHQQVRGSSLGLIGKLPVQRSSVAPKHLGQPYAGSKFKLPANIMDQQSKSHHFERPSATELPNLPHFEKHTELKEGYRHHSERSSEVNDDNHFERPLGMREEHNHHRHSRGSSVKEGHHRHPGRPSVKGDHRHSEKPSLKEEGDHHHSEKPSLKEEGDHHHSERPSVKDQHHHHSEKSPGEKEEHYHHHHSENPAGVEEHRHSRRVSALPQSPQVEKKASHVLKESLVIPDISPNEKDEVPNDAPGTTKRKNVLTVVKKKKK